MQNACRLKSWNIARPIFCSSVANVQLFRTIICYKYSFSPSISSSLSLFLFSLWTVVVVFFSFHFSLLCFHESFAVSVSVFLPLFLFSPDTACAYHCGCFYQLDPTRSGFLSCISPNECCLPLLMMLFRASVVSLRLQAFVVSLHSLYFFFLFSSSVVLLLSFCFIFFLISSKWRKHSHQWRVCLCVPARLYTTNVLCALFGGSYF